MDSRITRVPSPSATDPSPATPEMSKLLHLKREIFDPTRESAAPMERALRATPEQKLHILQFAGSSNAAKKAELKGLGVEFCRYIPDDAFVVRLSPRAKSAVESNPHVRALMPLHPAYKMPDTMAEQVLVPSNTSIPSNYDVVSPDPADKARLEQQIKQLGGEVVHPENGSLLLVASLTPSQLSKLVRLDTVSWVEPSTEIEVDMDNALIQGGAQAVQDKTGGYTGRGIVGHVLEGIDRNHPDFAANEFRDAPIAVADGRSTGHGTNTYGQIFGSGKGNEKARGIIPDAQGVYTNYNAVRNAQPGNTPNSRYELTERVMKDHNVMFQTASWGYARTTQYNARSAEMDQLIFDLDLPICQSQSNAGTRDSRPQAWAKNIISGGALRHQDNPDPTDDSWSGGASIGPASDGRIKPTLSGYYDRITTTSPGGRYTSSFGGTSGGTPIVAGYLGQSLEMFTDGIFGNKLPHQAGAEAALRFKNRPHQSTSQAMMLVGARQWEFSGRNVDRARVHQGWGFPNTETLYENRDKLFLVNEEHTLEQGESIRFSLDVEPGEPELKASLVYSDPAAEITAAKQLVNDLDLKVTAPDGTVYWGNNGLMDGVESKPGGSADRTNNIENVFLKNPAPGTWTFEVTAHRVSVDGHTETQREDVDFGLAVLGVKRPDAGGQ